MAAAAPLIPRSPTLLAPGEPDRVVDPDGVTVQVDQAMSDDYGDARS